MWLVSPTVKFISRVYRTAVAVRKCWRDGGAAEIKIAQLHRGEILRGRRILITGGSRGIGFAIARKSIEEGATVIITGRSTLHLEDAARRIASPALHTLAWDVSDLSQLDEKLSAAIQLARGDIDILINNAGVLGGSGHFLDLTETKWDDIMSTNAKALVFLTQRMVRFWIAHESKGKKIINMSSMRGFLGVKDGPYGMSKWALNGFTQGLGYLLLPYGIIVNGIAPGITDTNIEGVNTKENAYVEWNPPSHRAALPEEIAELAVFLMSDAANYIVGQTIVCDGGYSLKI